MVQLPGRISIRPLASFSNRNKTHTVSLRQDKMQVDQKFAYQTLRSQVNYKDVADIKINPENVQADPLTRTVTITTKKRQMYEIPIMDARDAMKLKQAIESQKSTALQKADSLANDNKSGRGTFSFSRLRR